VITVIALLYAFIPDVSRAYWIFAVMATQVYLIMYVLMFIAAVRLRRKQPDHARGYRAPALGLLCLVGGVSSVTALVIGFIAPSQFGHSEPASLRPPHPGRDTRDRDRSAATHGSASQAGVEGRRQRAEPRALTSTLTLVMAAQCDPNCTTIGSYCRSRDLEPFTGRTGPLGEQHRPAR
jgi:amino acid transporter